MKLFIKFIIIITPIFSIAQSTWHFNTGLSLGYNTYDVYLSKYEVESKHSFGGFLNVGYEYSFNNHFSGRVMLGFDQYYRESTVNNIEVSGYNFNFELPIEFRYTFYNKWTVGTGVSFQDYRDRNDLGKLNSYNFRTNYILSVDYQFNKNWAVNLKYSVMISDKIDAFVIHHYTSHFFLGVSYLLGYRVNNYNNQFEQK